MVKHKNNYSKYNKKPYKSSYVPDFPHNIESNASKAGESAFMAKVSFYSNPYKVNPCKGAWIRGYKRAEKRFNDMLYKSKAILDKIGFEEVEQEERNGTSKTKTKVKPQRKLYILT